MSRTKQIIDPYQAAAELPSLLEMKMQIEAAKPIALIAGILKRKPLLEEIEEIEVRLNHIVELVDGFYSLLGERNWVLHDSLNTSFLEEMLLQCTSPADAESRLIEHYQVEENLRRYIRRTEGQNALAARQGQIEKARIDYCDGRYDAAVLRLITVLDGFVNDFDKSQRCGLTSRDPKEMVGFDCLGGHYLGLSHAVEVFQTSITKCVEGEVFEVYRHGIVHGMVVNYNNSIVASKAWNYLFAVCDWADSFQKKREVEQPKPMLRETLVKLKDMRRSRKLQSEWKPHVDVPNGSDALPEPYERVMYFMTDCRNGNISHMVDLLQLPNTNKSEFVGIAKRYAALGIKDFQILNIEHPASARAIVNLRLVLNETCVDVRFCWLKQKPNGHPAGEYEDGMWVPLPSWQFQDIEFAINSVLNTQAE